ncbi:hypothetical protein CSW63_06790 [Caulobacter sp. FWC26]|nr:hypothetical protein CSW63_06790 [Caulobacter sp. FWC26]
MLLAPSAPAALLPRRGKKAYALLLPPPGEEDAQHLEGEGARLHPINPAPADTPRPAPSAGSGDSSGRARSCGAGG